jgi:hypothetical protein
MTRDLQQRILISAVVLVMGALYVGPLLVGYKLTEVQNQFYLECSKDFVMTLEYCLRNSQQKASLPFATYLLPFAPAIVVLWLNWLLKADFRMSEEKYPRRTLNGLILLGLICAAIAIWVPFSNVLSSSPTEVYKIADRAYWGGPYIAAGWLIAPLIFNHLFAPPNLIGQAKNCRIALYIVALTPIVALLLAALRQAAVL